MKLRHKDTSWARAVLFLPIALATLAVALTGCSDDYLAIVAVSPGSVGVVPGGQAQFSAAVVGISNQSVKWAVNGQVGGDETYGTISEDGLYTAPAEIPDEANVKISAMCAGDVSIHGDASAIIVSTITIEMEDFLTSYDVIDGRNISIVSCGAASRGKAVEGFDLVGDYLTFRVPFEVAGRYDASLRQAALPESEAQIKVTLEAAGPGGSDEAALFDIVGRGIT